MASNGGGGNNGGIFNMKIDTFDHKALMGPPKIPGLPDSVQLIPPSVENAAKKSSKKKKKSGSGSNNHSQTQFFFMLLHMQGRCRTKVEMVFIFFSNGMTRKI